MQDDSCATIAKLGGIVHLGDNSTVLPTLDILSSNLVLAYNVRKTESEYHIHLKTFYSFTLEFDDQAHHIEPNEELMFVVYLQEGK